MDLMVENAQQAQWGFEILLARDDFDDYFDVLSERGLFDSDKNPFPEKQEDGVYVPYWPALSYLEAVAKRAGERHDLALADKVLGVVRRVSSPPGEQMSDNHHTFRVFASILGVVPREAIRSTDLELVPRWLRGEYGARIVSRTVVSAVLPRFLTDDSLDDFGRLLDYCTKFNWTEEDYAGIKRKRPVTVVDDIVLRDFVAQNGEKIGLGLGRCAVELFLDRVRSVFAESGKAGLLYRPAVEDHPQNHSWRGAENVFIEGLRNTLLGWTDGEPKEATAFVRAMIRDEMGIVRRVAIHAIDRRWTTLKKVYIENIGPALFESSHLHEMYGLLRDHFESLPKTKKAATIEAFRNISVSTAFEDPARHKRYVQRAWLSAIVDQGYEPAEAWYKELASDPELGALPEHPDFNSYIESWTGPGPSPYKVDELVAYAEDGTLVTRLNEFQPQGTWRGSTVDGLVDGLEAAVAASPHLFVGLLPTFLEAKRPYQFGVINGFKKLWEQKREDTAQVDWDTAWPALIKFFACLLNDEELWRKPVAQAYDYPTSDWIPPVIAEFLHLGTRNDERAYAPVLLDQALPLIVTLLDKAEVAPFSDANDAMMHAINSPRGKAIEALFSYGLRICRLEQSEDPGHKVAWTKIGALFEKEVSHCTDANFEFSTLAGAYFLNLYYLNLTWLRDNLGRLFPTQFEKNLACALNGLSYSQPTAYAYKLLVEGGVIDSALAMPKLGHKILSNIVERLTLAYLWGDDDLESTRFRHLFDNTTEEELVAASDLMARGKPLSITPEAVDRILNFWERCAQWSRELPEVPTRLLSSLSQQIVFIPEIGTRELELLSVVAPFVQTDHHGDEFIQELSRLAATNPKEVSIVLAKMLEGYTPSYDYDDRLAGLITTLAESGQIENALRFQSRLIHLPGVRKLRLGD